LSGDLNIDIRESMDVMSVLTGAGDDFVRISRHIWTEDAGINVDMGAGENTLAMGRWPGLSSSDINNIDFSGSTLANVGTLQLFSDIDLTATDGSDGSPGTNLDVSTIGGLHTLNIAGYLDGSGGYSFGLTGPATLTVAVDEYVDDLNLMTTGILDLTMTSGGSGNLDLDSLTSDDITSLTVNADGEAQVDLDGSDDNLVTLASLTVTGDDVDLEMHGAPGDDAIPASGGVVETGTITFSGFSEDKATKGFAGNVLVSSSSLPGGSLLVNVTGSNNGQQVADAVAAALDAVTGIGASANKSGVITYTWDSVGARNDISAAFVPGIDGDAIASAESVTQQGEDPTPEIPATNGTGFEGLTDVTVDAVDYAEVEITDAYGAFTVDVDAGGDADVDMTGTGATSVDVDAGDYADVHITDSEDLTEVIIAAGDDDMEYSHLSLTNTDAVALIDLRNVTDNDDEDSDNAYIDVEVDMADFAGNVSVVIGTADVDYTTDALNAVRETFTFVGTDTGEIVINGFLASVGGTGDRLDFSQMAGIDAIDDLAITFDGVDTHITSLVEGIDVDITVTGENLSLDVFHFVF
jgi:hypothetical protein